jgi:hypothetical protein
MQAIKRVLVVSLLLLSVLPLLVGCQKGESDTTKIEATLIEAALKESIAAYNESDFEKCLTYVADLSEEKKTKLMGQLPGFRTITGEVTLRKTENIDIGGSIATADVTGTAQENTLTVEVTFMKQDGIWKVFTDKLIP